MLKTSRESKSSAGCFESKARSTAIFRPVFRVRILMPVSRLSNCRQKFVDLLVAWPHVATAETPSVLPFPRRRLAKSARKEKPVVARNERRLMRNKRKDGARFR